MPSVQTSQAHSRLALVSLSLVAWAAQAAYSMGHYVSSCGIKESGQRLTFPENARTTANPDRQALGHLGNVLCESHRHHPNNNTNNNDNGDDDDVM